MKISFIVPIYKVDVYLNRCIESLVSQTYRDIEVILVDDGSPDNCPFLCDEWAKIDNRIKVFHKPNGGLSDARNYGLNHANGDYVIFIDGDDFWIHNDDLAKLVRIASQNLQADFIGYNCKYFYPNSNTYIAWAKYADVLSNQVDKNTAICELVKSGTMPMSACLKLLKREFLVNNELFFVKGQISEDIPWFINLLDKSDKCMFVNLYIYAYRQNVAGSITNNATPEVRQRSLNSLYDIFRTELDKIESRSFNQETKDAIKSFLAYEYCILLTYNDIPKDMKKELYQYKGILNYTANPKVKMVSMVYRFFGIKITEYALKLYNIKRKLKR